MRRLVLISLIMMPLMASAGAELSEREYKLLTQVGELVNSEQYSEARELLQTAQKSASEGYAMALILHNLGQIELQYERYDAALEYLQRAYAQQAMPEEQQLDLLHVLAQLNCMNERWQRCVDHLLSWISQAPLTVAAEDYLLLAQAFSRQEKWRDVVPAIGKAIAHRGVAPEDWYQLNVVAHIQLQQWRDAIRTQRRLMEHYGNNAEHWRQLVSLYQQDRDDRAALAAQRLGYELGLLRSSDDYRVLSVMLLQADLPFYAGQVVEQGLEHQVLKHDKKHLELLSHSWILAKETDRALAALSRLNRVAPSKTTLTRMAHMQIEQQDWNSAEATIMKALGMKALGHGAAADSQLQILLGIAQMKQSRFMQARKAFSKAASDSRAQSVAQNWIRYLDQIRPANLLSSVR